jgi:hypothetical protein
METPSRIAKNFPAVASPRFLRRINSICDQDRLLMLTESNEIDRKHRAAFD